MLEEAIYEEIRHMKTERIKYIQRIKTSGVVFVG
jgi:hypothetical protein